MIVNETVRNFLFNQRRHGRDFATCAANLSDWFAEEITADEVEALWNEMIAAKWVAQKRNHQPKSKHPFAGEDPAAEKVRLKNANIMHLVDLKRAGHSPTRTEYVISAEGKGVKYATTPTSSYLGSAAATCVEYA
jgi:hypothetical protein